MKRLMEIRQRLAELKPLIVRSADAETLSDAEQTELTERMAEWDSLTAEAAPLEERFAAIENVRNTTIASPENRETGSPDGGTVRSASGAPEVIVRDADVRSALDDRSDRGEKRNRRLMGAILRANEDHLGAMRDAEAKAFEKIVRRHARSDESWAEGILARSTEVYADAWAKVTTGRALEMTNEERAAIVVGTNTAGGYLVPTFLDPTLIMTNDASSGVIRSIPGIRQVTLTNGNVWNGVTTDGVTASWDAELEEVSDDTPAFGTTGIPVFKGQAFVQASIEAFEDIANLDADVRMLMAEAKADLESAAFLTGNGTNRPLGLFTALQASASRRVVTQTAATIGEVDLHATYLGLRDRYRNRAVWLMATQYGLAVKRLGTSVSSSYSGDLREGPDTEILGRPRYLADDAPTTQTTTALDPIAVLFDPRGYVIVDKPGSFAVEFIPHLFNTANNRPDGRRGWYAHWRQGAGMPNLKQGVVLVDKTSA